MSKQSPLHWQQDTYSFHYDLSIRNEHTRFACMFYLFALFAFLTTLFLFILALNSYRNGSESIEPRFIAYSVIGSISFALFLIFFLGSLVYTIKLISISRFQQTSALPDPLEKPSEPIKQISSIPFVMNPDDSYYESTKALVEQKSRTKIHSYQPCQTDV